MTAVSYQDSDVRTKTVRDLENETFEQQLERQTEQSANAANRRFGQRVVWGRVLLIAGILLAWELLSGPVLPLRYTSKPSEIVTILGNWIRTGELWDHLATTAFQVIVGYVIGVLVGVGAALFLTSFRRTHEVLRPFIMAVYGIPRVAVAPIIVMWLGLGMEPKIAISAVIVFFTVFMNTFAGLNSVRPEQINIARVMGASRLQTLLKVMLPAAAPYMLTSMRIAIPDAIVGVLIGEFIAGSVGMGNLIRRSSNQMIISGVFAGILLLAAMVLTMRAALVPLERRFQVGRERT